MCLNLTKKEIDGVLALAGELAVRGLKEVINGSWTVELFRRVNRDFFERMNITVRNGCTKLVVLFHDADYVMKLNIAQGKTNFCQRECDLYQEAVKEGLERFFAEVELVGYAGEMPVYVQEVARPDEEYMESLRQNYVRSILPIDADDEQISEYAQCDMDVDEQVESIFGDVEGLCALTDFILYRVEDDDLEISADLHSGNFGFTKDNRVVLFDYSGFGW